MKYVYQIILLSTILLSVESAAIDTFAKIKQHRPENLNLANPTKSASGQLIAKYSLATSNIPLNEIHSWTLTLTKKNGQTITGALVEISADMPEHLHGMTTKPKVLETETSGEYLIKGMNFHMPGWWKITLDISGYGSRDLIRINAIVGEDNADVDHTQHQNKTHKHH
ncbi:FixH family protein [Thalassotalea psychrophila]|uniref:FixH family protein n=1 Tax=Thalassotalea psychrophila TaxID=3065647 RepID=A0ABY9TYH5_9GAMM|nr:FixH family protein [Colwelliaceae bacterium SQ149]